MSNVLHVLFVHQNYPAQFRHIAPALAALGWRCTFVTHNTETPPQTGVEKIVYKIASKAHPDSDPTTGYFQNETGHARGVYNALKKRLELSPDLVVAHSGFGSSQFVRLLFDAPIINFFEYFFHVAGQNLGYRPDAAVTDIGLQRSILRNAGFLLDLHNCDRGWCPNFHQRDTLPKEYHSKIEVIPEGIDTELWRPGARGIGTERRLPDGTVVAPGTAIVTYVARGFERMRGFDIFMKAAKLIYQQLPNVLFVAIRGPFPLARYSGRGQGRGQCLAVRIMHEMSST
jgi:glycosyltransferase involved in cell wall biosynthesis